MNIYITSEIIRMKESIFILYFDVMYKKIDS
jgi:hypothetical protein